MIDTHFHLRHPVELSTDNLALVKDGVAQWRAALASEIAKRPDFFPSSESVAVADPVLSADKRVLTVTVSGERSYSFVKFFEDTLPVQLYRMLPLSIRLGLDLGWSAGSARSSTWHALFSDQERQSIARVRGFWSDAALERLELRYNLVNDRPPLTAMVEPDGWAECPYCGFRFSTRGDRLLAGNIHVRCGQRLIL